MVNIAIYEDGCVEAVGIPDLFFNEDDFNYILLNKEAQKELIQKYTIGVTVGILGEQTADGFVEKSVAIAIPIDSFRKGDLGYNEKL